MRDRVLSFGGEVIPAKIGSDPKIIRAVRKVTVTQVAGSNREIVDMQNAWECYDQPYTLYIGDGKEDSIQEPLMKVASVLYKEGWQVLIDDYEPDIFRLAYYAGGFEADNRHTRLSKFDVVFRCRPERFLISGNIPVAVQNNTIISNATAFDAKPLIHIEGSGDVTFTIAGQTFAVNGMVDYINIDTDKMDVYRLAAENKNSMFSGVFPVLKTGNNLITYTGNITAATIIPRFWVI